jgi:hypothetical protein
VGVYTNYRVGMYNFGHSAEPRGYICVGVIFDNKKSFSNCYPTRQFPPVIVVQHINFLFHVCTCQISQETRLFTHNCRYIISDWSHKVARILSFFPECVYGACMKINTCALSFFGFYILLFSTHAAAKQCNLCSMRLHSF